MGRPLTEGMATGNSVQLCSNPRSNHITSVVENTRWLFWDHKLLIILYCMNMHTVLCLLFLAALHRATDAIDCTGLPTASIIAPRLQALIDSDGGEGGKQIFVQDGPYFTCQVQGTTMGTYQELSVIMTYTVSNDNAVRVKQFEMVCLAFGSLRYWEQQSGSLANVDNNVDFMNTPTWINCSVCTGAANNDHHCQGE